MRKTRAIFSAFGAPAAFSYHFDPLRGHMLDAKRARDLLRGTSMRIAYYFKRTILRDLDAGKTWRYERRYAPLKAWLKSERML